MLSLVHIDSWTDVKPIKIHTFNRCSILISDTTYYNDIVDYLNGREDVSFDDEMFALEKLDFAVFKDGTIKG